MEVGISMKTLYLLFLSLFLSVSALAGTYTGTITWATGTNFFNRNIKFVDAANGNDTNDGSVNFPWMSVNYAQIRTPVGWTLALAPGTYAGVCTNGQINYYLETGATAFFAFHDSNNSICGDGKVYLTNAIYWAADAAAVPYVTLSNAVLNIFCHTLETINGIYPADLANNSCLTNHSIYADLDIWIDNNGGYYTTNCVTCYADTILVQNFYLDNDFNATNWLYLKSSVLNFYMDDGFNVNKAVISADICNVVADASSNPLLYTYWGVGYTFVNGNGLSFDKSVFMKDPTFTEAISVGSSTGNYQHP